MNKICPKAIGMPRAASFKHQDHVCQKPWRMNDCLETEQGNKERPVMLMMVVREAR